VIDSEGYRANVGIIIINEARQVLFAKRIGQSSWQFPQGGIDEGESPEQAMYRELYEEVGLKSDDIAILGRTKNWIKYRIPERLVRKHSMPRCIGQKQIWFLLQLLSDDTAISLVENDPQEFDDWAWVDSTYPETQVIDFKQSVYRQALIELAEFFPK